MWTTLTKPNNFSVLMDIRKPHLIWKLHLTAVTKITAMQNHKYRYRSQQPNLNKLETKPPGDSPNQIWMISGQWFYRRFFKNLPKIAHNSMKNRGSTPHFDKLSEGPPKEHPHKIWSKSVQRFERSQKKKSSRRRWQRRQQWRRRQRRTQGDR